MNQTNFLYNLLRSENTFAKSIGAGILKVVQLSGAEKRTAEKNLELKNLENDNLLSFLNGQDTAKKLSSVNINPKVFKVAVVKQYPFASSPSTLIHFIIAFKNLVKELSKTNAIIDIKKLDSVVSRMFSYNVDTQPTLLVQSDMLFRRASELPSIAGFIESKGSEDDNSSEDDDHSGDESSEDDDHSGDDNSSEDDDNSGDESSEMDNSSDLESASEFISGSDFPRE